PPRPRVSRRTGSRPARLSGAAPRRVKNVVQSAPHKRMTGTLQGDDMRKVTFGLAVAVALGAIGCGGSGDNATKFKGLWSYSGGTSVVDCPDLGQTTDQATGNLTITGAVGGAGDLLYNDGTGCNFTFKSSGSTAMILTGQTCSHAADSQGGTLQLRPRAWLLTTTDGRVMTETGNGDATYLIAGSSFACTFTASGTLTKVGM